MGWKSNDVVSGGIGWLLLGNKVVLVQVGITGPHNMYLITMNTTHYFGTNNARFNCIWSQVFHTIDWSKINSIGLLRCRSPGRILHAVPDDHFLYSIRNTFFKLKERLNNNAFQEAAVFDYKGISNPVSLSCCLYISSVKSLYSIEKKKQ